ncbi:MAG TPA: AMP-binding protein [Bacilli bacterium]|nr:AMP-binding protein [Bacilli bacterium]
MDENQKSIDELKEYREKLASLNDDEQKQRDLYLKQMSDGTLQGPSTGYASIDKPWLQYYSEESILEKVDKKTIYQYRLDKNKDYPNDISLNYLGIKISNKKFEKKIDDTAKSLKNMGVQKGDIISLCTINTPETAYLLYAANKIGAVVDLFDPRTNKEGISNYLEQSHSKYFFVLDNFLTPMYDNVKSTSIEKIIHISPYDSVPKALRIIDGFKKKTDEEEKEIERINNSINTLKNDNNVYDWAEFIGMGICENEIIPNEYEPNAVAAIVHTGGTTGLPKGVQLTNENFIAQYLNYKAVDFELLRQDKFLDILVPWVAYGLVFSFFVIPSLNLEHILIPSFNPDELSNLILKYKPNQILGIPAYYESLLSNEKIKKADLSFLKCMGSGGDHISPALEEKLNNFLKEHNSKSKFVKGYGMTELSSSAITCLKSLNSIGSVGAPLIKNNVAIIDPYTGKEVGYNEKGEVCIKGPTMMKSYIDSTKNDSVFKKHDDDTTWIHSGDIGYMTEQGSVFIVDRIKRMIIRKGFKVYPVEIEKVISSHYAVDNCVVVGIPNEEDVHTPKAYIVINEKFKDREQEILDEIIDLLNKKLPEYEIPYNNDYEFIEKIPHTALGKVDFNKLASIEEEKVKNR